MKSGSRHRDYIGTIYDTDCVELSEKLQEKCSENKAVVYAIFGLEICPSTKREHLQFYISFKNAKTGSALQKFTMGGKHHYQVRAGTPVQARNYCWKGSSSKRTAEPAADAIYWETGVLPTGQGKRTDIMKTKESLENGANLRDVIIETSSMQSIAYAQKYLTYFERKRNWKPEVLWFWGPTATGKSQRAFAICNDESKRYRCNETNKWWDGYDGHEDVILDDIRGDFCKFHILLSILDRYEHRVEVKGGYRQLLAKRIIVTSPYHPEKFYYGRTDEDIKQLVRRIDKVVEFKKKRQCTFFKTAQK